MSDTSPSSQSPSVHIEQLLREVRDHNRATSKLAASKSFKSFLRRLDIDILDVDLANAWVDAGPARTRDLDLENLAVL